MSTEEHRSCEYFIKRLDSIPCLNPYLWYNNQDISTICSVRLKALYLCKDIRIEILGKRCIDRLCIDRDRQYQWDQHWLGKYSFLEFSEWDGLILLLNDDIQCHGFKPVVEFQKIVLNPAIGVKPCQSDRKYHQSFLPALSKTSSEPACDHIGLPWGGLRATFFSSERFFICTTVI